MEKLIELLMELEASAEYADDPSVFLSDNSEQDPPELIMDIEAQACDVLILAGGSVNYKAIAELSTRGYRVGPGEQDSFGWLSGNIYTRKGVISYG